MRLKLQLQLENEIMPIDYRRSVISFIKLALSEYDEKYFKKFYNEKDNIIKPYTFSGGFKNLKIEKEEIIVANKVMDLNMSVSDYEDFIILYNSFNSLMHKKYRFSIFKNSWIINNIRLVQEKKIDSNDIVVKFMSPLCVRGRENKKDYYYSFEHEEFLDILKINIKEELKITNFSEAIVDDFEITPINTKKVIIKFYEKKIETSVGTFKLHGDKQLLEFLYKAGIGSKHSAGFGMFEIM